MPRSNTSGQPREWTVVVLAAGLGRRYGGSKQLEPVGPAGEILSDYALRDAHGAGAADAVFVVAPDLEPTWREHHRCWPQAFPIRYVAQRLTDLPEGFVPPPGRSKPWGTVHAVLSARRLVRRPFLVVNADDFYGRPAFQAAGRFLHDTDQDAPVCAAVGYPLREVLSPHGGVSRAVLRHDADGWLVRIEELRDLRREGDGVTGKWREAEVRLTGDELVSMNCWACTPAILPVLKDRLHRFLEVHGDSPSAECLLPEALGAAVAEGRARVRVLPDGRGWMGLTFPEDREWVAKRLRVL
jgi:hypothetical protein